MRAGVLHVERLLPAEGAPRVLSGPCAAVGARSRRYEGVTTLTAGAAANAYTQVGLAS